MKFAIDLFSFNYETGWGFYLSILELAIGGIYAEGRHLFYLECSPPHKNCGAWVFELFFIRITGRD